MAALSKKSAFSLAETLVTLVIIGIIAAIVIPSIMTSHRKLVNQVQLRKIYSVLTQISQMVIGEYGDLPYSDFYDGSSDKVQEWFAYYIKPYLKVDKVCYDEEGCWSYPATYMNGTNISNLSARGIGGNIVTFTTIEGILFNLDGNVPTDLYDLYGVESDNDAVVLHVDINGTKPPNIYGKDIFVFVFTNKGFVPAGNDKTRAQVNAECSEDGRGVWCISKIARNNWKLGDENL